MKLRIKGDSLRFRLSQTEVRKIAAGEIVSEEVHFTPNMMMKYSFSPHGKKSEIEAVFIENEVKILVPPMIASEWASSEAVALKYQQSNGRQGMSLLIEKDFACLKPRENQNEDESDMFPNPNEAHGHCS